jgi:hypothetical protein
VDVQPGALGEEVGRDQQPVCADDDRGRPELEPRPRALGLEHGDPEPGCDLLCRRRRKPATAARRRVGPREQHRDLVLRREPLEDIRPERRGRGDGDPSHGFAVTR